MYLGAERSIRSLDKTKCLNHMTLILQLPSLVLHSALMSNQTKVWKTKTGPLQGDKAWSRGPKSAMFEILLILKHIW